MDSTTIGIAAIQSIVRSIFNRIFRHREPKKLPPSGEGGNAGDGVNERSLRPFARKWAATWQTNSDSKHPWSTEYIDITIKNGKLHLENSECDNGYQWEGSAEVVRNSFLIGAWHSKKNHNSSGSLMLCLTNQGEFLLGFFLGPNTGGLENYGALILALSKDNLQEGKLQLAKKGPMLHEIFRAPNKNKR